MSQVIPRELEVGHTRVFQLTLDRQDSSLAFLDTADYSTTLS
jgi:hypothetical protein